MDKVQDETQDNESNAIDDNDNTSEHRQRMPLLNDANKINSLKTYGSDSDRNNEDKLKNNGDLVAHFSKNGNIGSMEGVKFQGLNDNESIYSDESNDDDDDDDDLPPIPDGGWGWVVVASSFIIAACADGLAFSFGLLHEEFTNYFETTQSKTAMIGSLYIATPLLVGPIMSALVDRYGCRSMTIIAGIISSISFILAAFSNSIVMLCFTFGFMSGLGMGVLYVTSVVSVAFWFDKRRNLAVSLASCGMGFGTLIYSPMTSYLLEIFDWRNTVVILAGTLLNMCVCGALMRDPDWLTIKQDRTRKMTRSRKSSSAGSISNKSTGGESVIFSAEEIRNLLKSGKSPDYILTTLATSIAEAEQLDATTKMNEEQAYKRMQSAIHLPTFIQQNERVPPEVIDRLMANKRIYNLILENYPTLLNMRSHSEIQIDKHPGNESIEPSRLQVTVKVKTPNQHLGNNMSKDIKESKLEVDEPKESLRKVKSNSRTPRTMIHRKDWISKQISVDNHYLRDMSLYKNTIVHRGAMMNIPRYKLRAASLPNIYKNSMWSLSTMSDDDLSWPQRLWQICKTTFNFRMFNKLHFLIFNVASLILSVWFIVPYFFLQSYMTAIGTEGGPVMISTIGIASSIGIVALGWAGDQPWINVTKTYAACLIVCGLSVGAYPFFITNYWALIVISIIFGVSFASSYSYTPTILLDLMPLEQFTVAYGLILLSQGIGHLIGPPIAGMIYDVTGEWELTFYMGGAWLIVSGACVGIVGFTQDVKLCGVTIDDLSDGESNENDAV